MAFPPTASSSSLLLVLLLFAAAAFSSVSPLSVFEAGSFETTTLQVGKRDPSSPPRPVLVITPTSAGSYPILLFAHGTYLRNSAYSRLLGHISSHGFIVVAPQLFDVLLPSGPTELEYVAGVANWLSSGLPSILPEGVEADLDKLAVSGHSRGGKSAFALALGYAETPLLEVSISALIGVDPVAGSSKDRRTEPKVLTYEPHSFNLSIPVAVIGTGLGNQGKFFLTPPCAPDEVNHMEFYSESKAPASHFVAADYGHMDMLDDGFVHDMMCKSGKGRKDPMRRTVGGIVVAFLKAYLKGESGDYMAILENPSAALVKLSPVDHIVLPSALGDVGESFAEE